MTGCCTQVGPQPRSGAVLDATGTECLCVCARVNGVPLCSGSLHPLIACF